MNQHILTSLRSVYIFSDLDDSELVQLARLCKVLRVNAGHAVFREGDEGTHMFIIQEGSFNVSLNTHMPDGTRQSSTINVLYSGQSFGELVLLYGANRSATVTAIEPGTLLVLHVDDFEQLCETRPQIGYRVMRQLASDLAYKLRSSNLLLRGNIRWRNNELARQRSSEPSETPTGVLF